MKRKLYSLNFLYGFGFTMVSKLMPAILASAKIATSAFQISLVSASYHLARSISTIYSGYLSDRFGRRKSMLVGFLVTALVAFFMLFANSIELYAIAFFLIGLVASLFYLSLGALASIIFKKKAEAFSKLEAAYQLGFIAGPFVGGALAVYMGSFELSLFGTHLHLTTPLIFLAWVIICLIGFFVSLSVPVTTVKRATVRGTIKDLSTVFRKNFIGFSLFFVVGSFTIGFVEGARDILVPLRAVDLGMGVLDVGVIFSVSAVITMIGVIPGSSISDRFGRGMGLVLGFSLVAVAFALMVSATSLVALAVLTGLLSLGRSIALATNRAFASDIIHEKFRATGLSAVDALFLFGRVVGPLAAGLLKDAIHFQDAVLFFGSVTAVVVVLSAAYYLIEER
ncbi:MAG: MFS transporter [Candidatus Diapherotrites archaeon]|nr:MFS transporter [Candidatus Diapherotrites archaeon]